MYAIVDARYETIARCQKEVEFCESLLKSGYLKETEKVTWEKKKQRLQENIGEARQWLIERGIDPLHQVY